MIQKKSEKTGNPHTETDTPAQRKAVKFGKRSADVAQSEEKTIDAADSTVNTVVQEKRRLSADIDRQAHYLLRNFAARIDKSVSATVNSLIYDHCML